MKTFPVIALALLFSTAVFADTPAESLLPPFSGNGREFTKTTKNNHSVQGWLPAKWVDNSTWAAVNATYTKLADSPEKDAAAVRIEVQNVDSGQLQLTTYAGNHDYKKGVNYVVSGWVRSEQSTHLWVGAREEDEPHAFYQQMDLAPDPEWKRFEFVFTPEMDCLAWILFYVKQPGAVDIAGITVVEKF